MCVCKQQSLISIWPPKKVLFADSVICVCLELYFYSLTHLNPQEVVDHQRYERLKWVAVYLWFWKFPHICCKEQTWRGKGGIAKRPALKILTSWKWWWNLKERGEVPRFPVLILQRFHQGPPPGRPQSPDVNASSLQIKTCKQSNQCKQFMGRCCLHIWVSYSTLFLNWILMSLNKTSNFSFYIWTWGLCQRW